MKKIPYGIANFEAIKENDNYYFVDKTRYIELIESLGTKYHFFLRPRRFGKSLFISILEHYYDINRKNQFEQLFGNTYIGKNPTPLRNSYPVLKLNFSGLPTYGDINSIQNSFNLKIRGNIHTFYVFNSSLTGGETQFEKDYKNLFEATDIFNEFVRLMYERGIKYILLIDEYDNFANNILTDHGKDNYQIITHGSGFLKGFFAVIKNATETRTVERMFVTGVSPLVLSDVTSGMNIGDNISPIPEFNSMIGFTQREVETMLDYYIENKVVKKEDREEILDIFRINYNNYCFSKKTNEKVYNSDMILYFFNKYIQQGEIPSNLLDENVRIDYSKMQFLILESKKLNGNFDILSEIVEKGECETDLIHSFALKELIEESKFKSLLYYLGLLSIKEFVYGTKFVLSIPNEVIRIMHFDYIRNSLKDSYDLKINIDFLKNEFDNLAFKGEWEKLLKYIIDKFYEASSIRDFIYREQGIKSFMLAYLNVTPLYFVESEKEMNKGYADIFLRKNYFTTPKTKYEYIIELKYVKSDEDKSEKAIELYKKEALEQIDRYAKSHNITCELKKIVIICSATELLYMG